ncbi:MAG: tRNA guanosine transglycosylase [Phycisphaerales bacterium]
MALRFDILHRSSSTLARLGRVHTAHGPFDTPAFMPVGTRAAVKGLFPGHVARIGAQIVLANTYHLLLRPGDETVKRLGGLHRFMNWHGPILTDSGGYQAYSMADINTVSDDGVRFKSIIDGSIISLSPERAIQIQNNLGADIIMAFDDCPPSVDPQAGPVNQTRLRQAAARDARAMADADSPDADRPLPRPFQRPRLPRGYDHAQRLRIANERTVHWLLRCRSAHARPGDQSLFGIVQGGTDLSARDWSAQRVTNIDLPGYAIGGVAVGEQSDDIARVVRHTAPLLPDAKPRYLMGVGYERDLVAAVRAGVDMFDCVLPTRNGRNANAFTPTGQIRLRNAAYAHDPRPIQPGCDCPACAPTAFEAFFGSPAVKLMPSPAPNTNLPLNGSELPGSDSPFSRAYIRHLFFAKEMLGPILVSLHNLRHFQRFMEDLRGVVRTDDWAGFGSRWPVAADGL